MFALLMVLAAAGQTSQTLAEIGQGRFQCRLPDAAAKTCESIASYRAGPDGSWVETADQLLPSDALTQVTTETRVTLDQDTICGPARKEDMVVSKLIKGGERLDPMNSVHVMDFLATAFGPTFGRDVCTHYRYDANGVTAEISIDGKRSPAADVPVSWITPGDGYTLRRRGAGPAQ